MDMAQSRPNRLVVRILPLVLGALLATAFASPAAAATYTEETLYGFCPAAGCSDGETPLAGLISDASGNLYGTTYYGGANGYGAVFRLTKSASPPWPETPLYSFTGGTDGAYPGAGLIMDSSGNLYGTTVGGGASGYGTVFKVTSTGTETVLYSFAGPPYGGFGADGAYPTAGLVVDGSGNLYGTTSSGGVNSTGTVFEVTPAGVETVLYSFCSQTNCADGAYPMAGLIMDSAGNLYGTTASAGALLAGNVFQLTPGTPWTETTLYSFCSEPGCSDGAVPFAGLIMDITTGNLYGTTSAGGGVNDGGTVFQLSKSASSPWPETVLYNFCSLANCTDGYYPSAGLIRDSSGNLFGTTSAGGVNDDGTVFQLTAPVAPATAWTETVLYSFTGGADGAEPGAGVIMDAAGNLDGTTEYGGKVSGGAAPSGGGTVFTLIPSPAVGLSAGQQCNGTFDGTFNGNITVSAGQSCIFIYPCTIKGNVTVNGGTFELLGCTIDGNLTENAGNITVGPRSGQMSNVTGNVQISGASGFSLGGSTIGGNLQVQQVTMGQSPETVCGMQVNGNLQVQNNASEIMIGSNNTQTCAGNAVVGNLEAGNNTDGLSINSNTVGGNLQAQNDGTPAIDVSGNKVTGNLQCQNNADVTELGGNNAAHGNVQSNGNVHGNCTATHF